MANLAFITIWKQTYSKWNVFTKGNKFLPESLVNAVLWIQQRSELN